MKKSDYPDRVERKAEYTAGDVAVLLGVAHRTACTLIDTGAIPGRRNPVGRKERLVAHGSIAALGRSGGRYAGILSKITGSED